MEREILFRGKRTDNGEWVYGYFVKYKPCALKDEIVYGIVPTYASELYLREVDPETVGQYTGLEDKNGQKIFEDDIVEGIAYSFNRRGVIVWIDEIAGFGVRYLGRPDPTAWEKSSILKQITYGRKDEFAAAVIGNIYDNPELLEVKHDDD